MEVKNLNPVTMQCQLQECELQSEAEKSPYISCAPEMTPLVCQLLQTASSHFLPCCPRTWLVLADMIRKTMLLSRSLQPRSPPTCTPDSCRTPGSAAAAEREAGGGSVHEKTATQPLQPPATILCNNRLVHPCDLITASKGLQRELKGVKTPTRFCFRSSEKLGCFLHPPLFAFHVCSSGYFSLGAAGRPGSLPDLFVHSPRVGLGCWPVSLVSWLSLQPGAEAAQVMMQRLVWAGRAKQVWGGIGPSCKWLCRLPPWQG